MVVSPTWGCYSCCQCHPKLTPLLQGGRPRLHCHRHGYGLYWCELGFPIFGKVLITLDLVESRHNSIRLPNNSALNPAIAAPRHLWLSTGVARSTSPRRLSPCLRIKNTRKNTKECNQIADEWLISQSWGLTNRWRRRNCCQQNNLSKTPTLM
jgi:hypothetical protein